MFCPCEECGDFTVSPLMSCDRDKDYCSAEPYCTPCIPQCVKVPIVYCCEKPKPKAPPKGERDGYCAPLAHHSSHDTRHSNNCDCSRCHYCSPPCCASQPSCCKNHSHQHDCNHHECNSSCDEYCHTPCKPVRTKYVIPCYRYEDGRIERYVPTRHGTLPMSAYKRNGIQDHVYGYRGAQKYLCAGQCCDGVKELPVSAFKRNGMQDQEFSKQLGTMNCLQRYPRDVSVEYDVCTCPVKVCDPVKVPEYKPLANYMLRKKPIEANQPTVLARRACEMAVGARCRRKPYVHSTYSADCDQEVHKYCCEDEQGNCCFHFQKNSKSHHGYFDDVPPITDGVPATEMCYSPAKHNLFYCAA